MSSYGLRLSSITIDADGSPSGYIAWYNHSTETGKIRVLRPSTKNDKYGVQRMEMLAIYFALADNQWQIKRMASNQTKKQQQQQQQQQLVINVRSDSKTSVEQLQGISEVRDSLMQRICAAIKKLLEKMMMSFMIIFNHLDRTRNIAGLLLEQRRRKEEEKFLMHQYQKQYYCCSIDGLLGDLLLPGHNYSLTTA
jgi:hypothetical protein